MSLNDLDPELADAAAALVDAAGRAGLQPRVTSTVRTRSEQARLYRRFLAGAAGYPVAPPGFSAHEYGWAFDMVLSPMEALADAGYTWQQWGGGWNPRDAIHFELPGASERAKQQGQLTSIEEPGFWANVISGLPIAFWPSMLFQILGIPTAARKTVTPAQERELRQIVKGL